MQISRISSQMTAVNNSHRASNQQKTNSQPNFTAFSPEMEQYLAEHAIEIFKASKEEGSNLVSKIDFISQHPLVLDLFSVKPGSYSSTIRTPIGGHNHFAGNLDNGIEQGINEAKSCFDRYDIIAKNIVSNKLKKTVLGESLAKLKEAQARNVEQFLANLRKGKLSSEKAAEVAEVQKTLSEKGAALQDQIDSLSLPEKELNAFFHKY